jgi:hypothetical protein
MKKLFKPIFISSSIIVVCISLILIVYDLIAFRKYLPVIEKQINGAHIFYKNKPKRVYDIAMLAENKRLNSYVVQVLLTNFDQNKNGMIKWHIEYFLWNLLLKIHFNDDEIFTLWCDMFPFENGKGLNESANFFYGRNIDHLNAEEITSIIARLKAPLYYKKNPQELEKRVKELLKEVESSKTRARP